MDLIPRSAWDARPPTSPLTHVDPDRRTETMIHDNGPALTLREHTDCLAAVLGMQRYHQLTHGWADIGYNVLVCPHGAPILGRGLEAVGAHCPDHNTSGYGIQVMVGGDQVPTVAALATTRALADWLDTRSGHPLTRLGHRDGFTTDCPGDWLYQWIHAGMPLQEEDELPTPAEIAAAVWDHGIHTTSGEMSAPAWAHVADTRGIVGGIDALVRSLPAEVTDRIKTATDPAAIADAVLAALPADLAVDVVDELAKRVTR